MGRGGRAAGGRSVSDTPPQAGVRAFCGGRRDGRTKCPPTAVSSSLSVSELHALTSGVEGVLWTVRGDAEERRRRWAAAAMSVHAAMEGEAAPVITYRTKDPDCEETERKRERPLGVRDSGRQCVYVRAYHYAGWKWQRACVSSSVQSQPFIAHDIRATPSRWSPDDHDHPTSGI